MALVPIARPASSAVPSSDRRLQRLIWLRCALMLAQLAAIAVGHTWLALPFSLGAGVLVVIGYAIVTLMTVLRLRRHGPVCDREFFGHLLLDVVLLTVMLAVTGASANPFVSLYLLPLIIAAITLPARYAWSMTALTVACYAALFAIPSAGPGSDHHAHAQFQLHLLGMWVNFTVSALAVAVFVVRLAQDVRQRDAWLAARKVEALRNERIVALGALAAGTAHELGTPLSTMAVLLGDIARDHADDPVLSDDIAVLRSQVDACKQAITRMAAAAGAARAEGASYRPLDEFLDEALERWRVMRPAVQIQQRFEGPRPAPPIFAEQTLAQAILSLLNNAADASPQAVEVDAFWSQSALTLEIRDRGVGLAPEARERAGEAFFSTKPAGSGIGLFLARATIERLGGRLRLRNREAGGACTRVELPVGTVSGAGLGR
jgi:two-component system sensor histidine kinase RegB